MLRQAILVNGVPASGKSTVAKHLSRTLGLPLFGLDTVKEALFEELGTGDRLYNRRMGRASFGAIWAVIGACPPGSAVIVDAWFGFQPAEFLTGHMAAAEATAACEVWCHADPALIAQRYLDHCAERPAGHLGPDYAPELRLLAERAEPLGLASLIRLDTGGRPDLESLTAKVSAHLPGYGGANTRQTGPTPA